MNDLKKLDNNEVKTVALSKPLAEFTTSSTFVLKDVRVNNTYVNGKKENEIQYYIRLDFHFIRND